MVSAVSAKAEKRGFSAQHPFPVEVLASSSRVISGPKWSEVIRTLNSFHPWRSWRAYRQVQALVRQGAPTPEHSLFLS